MHVVSGMTSFALVTAVLLRTQCPAPEVMAAPPELRDPFVVAEVERELAPVSVRLPSDLVDPFSRRGPARALPRPAASAVPADLVDPFAHRRVRPDAVPSRLGDPFAAKPTADLPAMPPTLTDPFQS